MSVPEREPPPEEPLDLPSGWRDAWSRLGWDQRVMVVLAFACALLWIAAITYMAVTRGGAAN